MMTVAQFYSDPHIGLRFGVVDKLHKYGHSGQDINGWAAGTAIPNLFAGEVVQAGFDEDNLGYYATVRSPDVWITYCHFVSQWATVGQQLAQGQAVGPLGTSGWSKGPHVHVMTSRLNAPTSYRNLIDPLPYIRLARSGGGGSGGGDTPRKVNQDMLIIRHDYAGGDHYFHFWPGGVKYLGSPSQAATLSGASGVVIAAANGDQLQEHIWNMGLAEFTADTVRALKDGGVPSFMLHAGWTRSSSTATPPDLGPLIARLDQLDAAVAAVPGAVIVEQKKPGN